MNKPNDINIVLVDDHTLFRNGLKNLLNDIDDFRVVAEAENGKKFIELLDDILPDIVLLDISMPVMDGVEAATKALELHEDISIITLSMFADEAYYKQMVEAGVRGFILKDASITEVETAIRTVYQGKTFFSQELLQSLLSGLNNDISIEKHELSDREIEVIEHVCMGKSNFEIADDLCISKRTVEKHRANIMEKTKCKNTAALVIFAVKHKIVNV